MRLVYLRSLRLKYVFVRAVLRCSDDCWVLAAQSDIPQVLHIQHPMMKDRIGTSALREACAILEGRSA